MARIRSVKPEFWNDEKLGPLDPLTRLVFLGLIGMADDLGRVHDNVKAVDAFIFPFTDDSSRQSLDTLATLGIIRRGISANGKAVIEIVNWSRHQRIDKPGYRNTLPPILETVGNISRESPGSPVESPGIPEKSAARIWDRDRDRERDREREREQGDAENGATSRARAALAPEYWPVFDALVRASHNPTAFAGSVLMLPERVRGATWEHVGQALTDLSLLGKAATGKLLIAFTRGAMTGEHPSIPAGPAGRQNRNLEAIAEGVRRIKQKEGAA